MTRESKRSYRHTTKHGRFELDIFAAALAFGLLLPSNAPAQTVINSNRDLFESARAGALASASAVSADGSSPTVLTSLALPPGECIVKFTDAYSESGEHVDSSEEICGPDVVETPLSSMALPLALGLLFAGGALGWRRSRPVLRAALGLLALCSLSPAAFALRGANGAWAGILRARCDYHAPVFGQNSHWWGEFYNAVTYGQTYGNYSFTFDGNANMAHNGQVVWLEDDLPGSSMGITYTLKQKNPYRHIKSCEIYIDPNDIAYFASLQNADPYQFLVGIERHEWGHCLGFDHFWSAPPDFTTYTTPAGLPSQVLNSTEEARSVMNNRIWNYINSPAQFWWGEALRYSSAEIAQLQQDCPP